MNPEDTDELKKFVREYHQMRDDYLEVMTWAKAQMDRQRRRDEMWRKVWESTLGNLVWALFIGGGYITWEFIKTRLK